MVWYMLLDLKTKHKNQKYKKKKPISNNERQNVPKCR